MYKGNSKLQYFYLYHPRKSSLITPVQAQKQVGCDKCFIITSEGSLASWNKIACLHSTKAITDFSQLISPQEKHFGLTQMFLLSWKDSLFLLSVLVWGFVNSKGFPSVMIQKQKLCLCGFVGRLGSVLYHLRICPVIVFHFIDRDNNTMTKLTVV